MALLHPLECFLLETFTSVEHFYDTRDAIISWIDAHEDAYARQCAMLDARERGKSLWEQGDVVWGSKVLPNIRSAKDIYIRSCVLRLKEDPEAFKIKDAMRSFGRGISEFWGGWMTKEEKIKINSAFSLASKLEGRTNAALHGPEGLFTYLGQGDYYELKELPSRIPRYELDPLVRVRNYEDVKGFGLYLPDAEFSSACLLSESGFTGRLTALKGIKRSDYIDDSTGERSYDWVESEWAETEWTLIRRVEGEYIEVPREGFFPRGTPDELYSWPERESQYIRRDAQHICAMSDEAAVHSGKWAYAGRNGFEYCDVRQGKYLPRRNGEAVKWTLIQRSDGGSCLAP